jgi:hypothetical protein
VTSAVRYAAQQAATTSASTSAPSEPHRAAARHLLSSLRSSALPPNSPTQLRLQCQPPPTALVLDLCLVCTRCVACCSLLQPCTSFTSSGSEGSVDKRRRFMQMRKQHYNMRDALLKVRGTAQQTAARWTPPGLIALDTSRSHCSGHLQVSLLWTPPGLIARWTPPGFIALDTSRSHCSLDTSRSHCSGHLQVSLLWTPPGLIARWTPPGLIALLGRWAPPPSSQPQV